MSPQTQWKCTTKPLKYLFNLRNISMFSFFIKYAKPFKTSVFVVVLTQTSLKEIWWNCPSKNNQTIINLSTNFFLHTNYKHVLSSSMYTLVVVVVEVVTKWNILKKVSMLYKEMIDLFLSRLLKYYHTIQSTKEMEVLHRKYCYTRNCRGWWVISRKSPWI